MKKIISAVLSASLAVSSMGALFASATEKYGDGKNIIVFGDSIAEGYDLSETEYNYGQIIADYLGGTVNNYAKAGEETAATLAKVKDAKDLKDADIVIISSGANDVIHYAASKMIALFDSIGCLNSKDIPANPTFGDAMKIIDIDSLKTFAANAQNATELNSAISKIAANIYYTSADKNAQKYDCVIEKQVIPNINEMISAIKAVNPNAKIVVQNIYNPLQLEAEYLEKTIPASYKSMFNLLSPQFNKVVDSFVKQVNNIEGAEIADVYNTFTAGDGCAWYFTGFQDVSVKEFKIHPNQAGHLAIAVNILNTLGEKSEDGGLLNITYESKIDKKSSYPAVALEDYKKVAGSYIIGNVDENITVDASDASLVLEAYSLVSTGEKNPLAADYQKAADVNKDGLIDATDASAILEYYAYAATGGKSSFKRFNAEK